MNFIKTEKVPPNPSSEIYNWKSIGYSPGQAVADLIDNSIFAKAKNIWITLEWKEKDSVLSITDDGIGMEESDLRNKMQFGWKNPREQREKDDLGRFGMGMKVASISQCNSLTVISKTKSSKEICAWTWDVAHVVKQGEWELGIPLHIDDTAMGKLKKIKSGTSVIWNDIDFIDWKNLDRAKETFYKEYSRDLKLYIETYFHRFLEDDNFNIYINENKCEPWDPFLEKINPEIHRNENITEDIKVTSFVIPHENEKREGDKGFKEWKKIRDRGKGIKGWQHQQGLYFYRNKRLIINGEWLDKENQESHTLLARLRVDLPNTYDLDWQIGIQKSNVIPKGEAYERLRTLSSDLRARANKVYRYRGAKSIEATEKFPDVHVWNSKERKNKPIKITINRDHPAIDAFIKKSKNIEPEQILRLIEKYPPYDALQVNLQNNQGNSEDEPPNNEETLSLLKGLLKDLIENGCTKEEAIKIITRAEPGYMHPDLIGIIEKDL